MKSPNNHFLLFFTITFLKIILEKSASIPSKFEFKISAFLRLPSLEQN